eukprot:g3696.t1
MATSRQVNTPLLSNLRLVTEDSLDRQSDAEAGRNHPDSATSAGGTAVEPQGSFSSSVFMVLNSAVGTGILTLPFAFRCAGVYGGIISLVAYVLIEYLTITAIVRCCHASGATTYSDIVRQFLGERTASLVSVVISVYCFFACTAAFIIVKNVTKPILLLASGGVVEWWTQEYFPVLVSAALAFPLMCLRSITSLRFTAMLSFTAIMFVAGVVVSNYFLRRAGQDLGGGGGGGVDASSGGGSGGDDIYSPPSSSPSSSSGAVNWDGWGEWPSALLAIPNVFLSLQCHIQIPIIYADLRPDLRSVRRMSGVAVVAYGMCLTLYSAFAIFGAMTFGRATQPNIMESAYDAKSWEIIAARGCLTVTAVFSIPCNHHPAREAIWDLLSSSAIAPRRFRDLAARTGGKATMPQTLFMSETCIFWALALGLGLGIKELSTLNDLMGLTVGVAVIFLLPGMFALKYNGDARGNGHGAPPTGKRAISTFLTADAWGEDGSNGSSQAGGGGWRRAIFSKGGFYLLIGGLTLFMSAYSFIASSFCGVAPPEA